MNNLFAEICCNAYDKFCAGEGEGMMKLLSFLNPNRGGNGMDIRTCMVSFELQFIREMKWKGITWDAQGPQKPL